MLLAETPQHSVTLRPFRMDRCEVTNRQYQTFVQARPMWRKGEVPGDYLRHWNGNRCPKHMLDLPVVYITWHAAVAYCAWAGKRLPTEAEWEFAARGGAKLKKYPWGDEDPTPRHARFGQADDAGPARVGAYPPNVYGLHDLAGNVWEFCLDAWQDRYASSPSVQTDEDLRRMRQASAERRVIRGGSFAGSAMNLRVTARDSHRADNPVAHVGFRCAGNA